MIGIAIKRLKISSVKIETNHIFVNVMYQFFTLCFAVQQDFPHNFRISISQITHRQIKVSNFCKEMKSRKRPENSK